MKDPYLVLGLTDDATADEIRERYESLKAKYKEERFLPGEEGNNAARKLTELEEAWRVLSKKVEMDSYADKYAYLDKIIKEKKYDEAQRTLDGIVDRTAEWHFYQSKVYYCREWLTECRKQLLVAIDLDPTNEKYKATLDKLDMVMGNSKARQEDLHGDDIDAARANADRARAQEMNQSANTLSNCCTAYCCTSLCCDAMSCCCR